MVQNGYYGHTNPKTGVSGMTYMRQALPHPALAENLNIGPPQTAHYYFESWMNSPGHRKNILDPQYTQTGFAVCFASHEPGKMMLVEHFSANP